MSAPADTSQMILRCAADLLAERGFDDISYKHLGEGTGVSERTVYRHFPTRSHLLSQLALWVENEHFSPAPFTTWEGFYSAIAARFSSFDAAPAQAVLLARAASLSPLDNAQSSFFSEAVTALVKTSAPRLNGRDGSRTASALCYFASAQFWVRCRYSFDFDAGAITEAFRNATGEILAAMPAGTWPAEAWRTNQGGAGHDWAGAGR